MFHCWFAMPPSNLYKVFVFIVYLLVRERQILYENFQWFSLRNPMCFAAIFFAYAPTGIRFCLCFALLS